MSNTNDGIAEYWFLSYIQPSTFDCVLLQCLLNKQEFFFAYSIHRIDKVSSSINISKMA